jgi:hypothetical protein
MIGALWEGTIFGLHIVIGFVLLAVGLHHSKDSGQEFSGDFLISAKHL